MPGLGEVLRSAFSPCGSRVAASSPSVRHGIVGVDFYDMKAVRVLQRVTIHDCIPEK
jgi:hypothetical protein